MAGSTAGGRIRTGDKTGAESRSGATTGIVVRIRFALFAFRQGRRLAVREWPRRARRRARQAFRRSLAWPRADDPLSRSRLLRLRMLAAHPRFGDAAGAHRQSEQKHHPEADPECTDTTWTLCAGGTREGKGGHALRRRHVCRAGRVEPPGGGRSTVNDVWYQRRQGPRFAPRSIFMSVWPWLAFAALASTSGACTHRHGAPIPLAERGRSGVGVPLHQGQGDRAQLVVARG